MKFIYLYCGINIFKQMNTLMQWSFICLQIFIPQYKFMNFIYSPRIMIKCHFSLKEAMLLYHMHVKLIYIELISYSLQRHMQQHFLSPRPTGLRVVQNVFQIVKTVKNGGGGGGGMYLKEKLRPGKILP